MHCLFSEFILDILVQRRRNKAAKKFFHKLLKWVSLRAARAHHGQAQQLRGRPQGRDARCRAAQTQASEQSCRELAPADAATRADDAPLQIPRPCPALSVAFGPIREPFCPRRHRLKAQDYRAERQQRLQVWNKITGAWLAA